MPQLKMLHAVVKIVDPACCNKALHSQINKSIRKKKELTGYVSSYKGDKREKRIKDDSRVLA